MQGQRTKNSLMVNPNKASDEKIEAKKKKRYLEKIQISKSPKGLTSRKIINNSRLSKDNKKLPKRNSIIQVPNSARRVSVNEVYSSSLILKSPNHNSCSIENIALSFSSKQKLGLKYLNLNSELELNRKILTDPKRYVCKSCLDNIIMLDNLNLEGKLQEIEENLRLCNFIVRDIIGRMSEYGKNNEGVLIEKLWKHVVLSVDELMVNFKKSDVNLNDSDLTIKKVSILDDSCGLDSDINREDLEEGVRNLIKTIGSRIEGLNEVVVGDWKKINRSYFEGLKSRGLVGN